MTNEDKAKEIAENNKLTYYVYEKCGGTDEDNSFDECYSSALEMAEWKERQMIDKACEWLKDMTCYYAHWEQNGDTYENEIVYDTEKLIEDFKKAMEE